MNRFHNFLPLGVAALVGAAVLGAPTQASATLALYLQEDGGAITQVATAADFTSVSFNSTFSDFTVNILGGSSDNGATLSDLLSSTTSVKNNTGATHTLSMWVSQTNYNLPAGTPLSVESGLGGTVDTGTLTLTGIFQAYADKNNGLRGTTDFTNGSQNATANGNPFDTGSAFGSFNRTGLYSLTSVANFKLSGGGQANFSSQVHVTPVPEPSSVVLALSSLPLLGIGTWLRRRKANV